MKIGGKIRALRLQSGMTMKDVGLQLKVSPSTYRDWEYGRKIPAEYAQRLARVFHVSVEDLTGGGLAVGNELSGAIESIERGLRLLKKLESS